MKKTTFLLAILVLAGSVPAIANPITDKINAYNAIRKTTAKEIESTAATAEERKPDNNSDSHDTHDTQKPSENTDTPIDPDTQPNLGTQSNDNGGS